ncbi:hypothetical protein BEL01nite_56240 [Bradyrhizobium elkanii]|nr:hypothetical protein BEL01nite_56240 [Bradyrhizobium elkanii]
MDIGKLPARGGKRSITSRRAKRERAAMRTRCHELFKEAAVPIEPNGSCPICSFPLKGGRSGWGSAADAAAC